MCCDKIQGWPGAEGAPCCRWEQGGRRRPSSTAAAGRGLVYKSCINVAGECRVYGSAGAGTGVWGLASRHSMVVRQKGACLSGCQWSNARVGGCHVGRVVASPWWWVSWRRCSQLVLVSSVALSSVGLSCAAGREMDITVLLLLLMVGRCRSFWCAATTRKHHRRPSAPSRLPCPQLETQGDRLARGAGGCGSNFLLILGSCGGGDGHSGASRSSSTAANSCNGSCSSWRPSCKHAILLLLHLQLFHLLHLCCQLSICMPGAPQQPEKSWGQHACKTTGCQQSLPSLQPDPPQQPGATSTTYTTACLPAYLPLLPPTPTHQPTAHRHPPPPTDPPT